MNDQALTAMERVQEIADGIHDHVSGLAAIGEGAPVEAQPTAEQAEEFVLAAMLTGHGPAGNPAVRAVRSVLGEQGDTFIGEGHRLIYRAILQADSNGGADALTVADYLLQDGCLDEVGGRDRLAHLTGLDLEPAGVSEHARIVRRLYLERQLTRAVRAVPRNPAAVAEAATQLTREQILADPRRAQDAADWLAAQPDTTPAVWGKIDVVLWAEGEPLMIYGPDGVGKTTLAQQITLGLCGYRRDVLLDLPIKRLNRPVLYLACDRPRQARRSFARMVSRDSHDDLRGRLLVWEGPLPFSIAASPKMLLDFCVLHEAGAIILDSLKDVVVDLTDPKVALRVNQAFQWLNASGIDILALHHPRKEPAGQPVKPKTLEDIYGDRNLYAGMGSIILLWGKAGDPIVELHHLKQPAGEFGPVKLLHDHDAGSTALFEHRSLEEILKASVKPMSVHEVARELFATLEPNPNQREKARRQLEKLVETGLALKQNDLTENVARFFLQ